MKLLVQNLSKSYGKTNVVSKATFTLEPGTITAFLGANGAGKTTIIRMMTNLLTKDSGIITFINSPSDSSSKSELCKPKIGIVLDKPSFVPHLTGRENLLLLSKIWKKSTKQESDIDKVLNTVNLTKASNNKASTYSTGMTKRLAIAFAIINNPDYLILDEPFEGLDPESRLMLKTIISNYAKQGKTIFLSSHQLSEIESISTHVVFLRQGKIIYQGKIDEVSEKIDLPIEFQIHSISKEHLNDSFDLSALKNLIKEHYNELIDSFTPLPQGFSLRMTNDLIPKVINLLVKNDYLIFKVIPQKESLENTYITLKNMKSTVSPTASKISENPTSIYQTPTSFKQSCILEIVKLFKSPGKIALLFLPSILPILLIPLLLVSPLLFTGFRAKFYIIQAINSAFTLSLSFSIYIYPVLCAILAADSFATESSKGIIDTTLTTGITRFKLFFAKASASILWLFTSLLVFPIVYFINIFIAWFYMDKAWWTTINLPVKAVVSSMFLFLFFFFIAQITIYAYWLLFSVSSSGFGRTIGKGMIPLVTLATLGTLSNEICALFSMKINPALSFFTTQYAKIGDFDLLESIFEHGVTLWPPYFRNDIVLLILEAIMFIVLSLAIFNRRDFNGGKD